MTLRETIRKRPLGLGVAAVAVGVVLLLLLRGRHSADSSATEAEPPTIVPVSVAPIVLATLHDYVDSWGTVEPQPATPDGAPASARVATPVAGIVAQVRCAEGQRVSHGQLLFSLDSRVADIAVSRARQAVQYAEQVFGRQQQLLAGGITSQKQYQEAEQNLATAKNELAAAQTQRALLDIRAPVAGTLTKVNAKPGDAVDQSSELGEIIDLDRLVVSSGVRSGEVAKVRRGQPVTLTLDSVAAGTPAPVAPETSGKVVFVGAAIDNRTDQVTVRVSVPRGAGWRPGQYLRVRIAVEARPNRLAVPVESIVTREGASRIAIVEGDRAVFRPVQVGLRDGNLVEVAGEGLKAGLTVVTAGAYGLPQESRIRVISR